jgi:hypothetical protein
MSLMMIILLQSNALLFLFTLGFVDTPVLFVFPLAHIKLTNYSKLFSIPQPTFSLPLSSFLIPLSQPLYPYVTFDLMSSCILESCSIKHVISVVYNPSSPFPNSYP